MIPRMMPPTNEQLLNSPNSYISTSEQIQTFGTDMYLLQRGWLSVSIYSLGLSAPLLQNLKPNIKSTLINSRFVILPWKCSLLFQICTAGDSSFLITDELGKQKRKRALTDLYVRLQSIITFLLEDTDFQ